MSKFKFPNRDSIKQIFIPLLRQFKANDLVIEEIYENLQALADAISEIDTGRSITLDYNSSTQNIVMKASEGIEYDSEDKIIVVKAKGAEISNS